MVRLGLLDSDDDEMPEAPSRSPYAAPTADDDTDEERDAPHAALDRTPRRSFSPGGLFSRADGSGRAEASPGARDASWGRPLLAAAVALILAAIAARGRGVQA